MAPPFSIEQIWDIPIHVPDYSGTILTIVAIIIIGDIIPQIISSGLMSGTNKHTHTYKHSSMGVKLVIGTYSTGASALKD